MSDILLDFAIRVEQGEGADSALDAEIHTYLFGTVDAPPCGLTYRDAFDRIKGRSHPYRFTSAAEDAEYALPGPEWPEWQITRRFGTGYHANVGTGEDGVGCEGAARALTSAGLRARATKGQDNG